MENKLLLKEINDHISRISPLLLNDDLESGQMTTFLNEKAVIQQKLEQLNAKSLSPKELRDLEAVG